MRNCEIIFKAKLHPRWQHLTSDGWAYGTPIYHQNGTVDIRLIIPENEDTITMLGIHRFEIIEESIAQYTGKRDSNGNRIYEGDIITDKENYTAVVLWNVDSCCFYAKTVGDTVLFLSDVCEDGICCEIIGNNFDSKNFMAENN